MTFLAKNSLPSWNIPTHSFPILLLFVMHHVSVVSFIMWFHLILLLCSQATNGGGDGGVVPQFQMLCSDMSPSRTMFCQNSCKDDSHQGHAQYVFQLARKHLKSEVLPPPPPSPSPINTLTMNQCNTDFYFLSVLFKSSLVFFPFHTEFHTT